MKSTLLLVLGAITASVVASQTFDPLDAPGQLEPRADKWCHLHDVTSTGLCLRHILKSDKFDVRCYVNGDPDPIHGNRSVTL
ncbi:hypothetical protein FRC00_014372 [Tulasnella sp. 408]|nr:hypothetical protein FRC00_014372 [Tulasnella sp. 408]